MKWYAVFPVLLLLSCSREKERPFVDYKTKKVIIIVIDGVRWSDSWGDSTRVNIPVRDSLRAFGVLLNNFRNNGVTLTNPGHTAICTGNYDPIANNGSELPHFPGLLQTYVKYKGNGAASWVVSSKDKLWVLGHTDFPGFANFPVSIDCGVNGDGTGGYRADSITFNHVVSRLQTGIPEVMVINFKDPDTYGHLGDSLGYLAAIRKSDWYVGQIAGLLQAHPSYAGQTALIVTNDHGRHTAGWQDGFVGHGDGCDGCRHVEFLAVSPDLKSNYQSSAMYEQTDISSTVATLLHLPWYYGKGRTINEILK